MFFTCFTGKGVCYLFKNGTLQELNWFKQCYGSWFLGDYVCEGWFYVTTKSVIFPYWIFLKTVRNYYAFRFDLCAAYIFCFLTDGGLYTATTIDPVFIMLPIFDEARMKV